MSIGKRIEEFRLNNKDRFKTKKKLSESLDIPYAQLYEYVTDKVKPGSNILDKLANLGCDINWLVTGRTHKEIIELLADVSKTLSEAEITTKRLQEEMPEKKEMLENLVKDMAKLKKEMREVKRDQNA